MLGRTRLHVDAANLFEAATILHDENQPEEWNREGRQHRRLIGEVSTMIKSSREVRNALVRKDNLDLAWRLTAADDSLDKAEAISFHMMRTQHRPEVVWGPLSGQYRYQINTPVEEMVYQIMRAAVQPACEATAAAERREEGAGRKHQKHRPRAPNLVLEMGANEGAHGLLAAEWGCRVESFEPQPVNFLQNTFSDRTHCNGTATARMLIPAECSTVS